MNQERTITIPTIEASDWIEFKGELPVSDALFVYTNIEDYEGPWHVESYFNNEGNPYVYCEHIGRVYFPRITHYVAIEIEPPK